MLGRNLFLGFSSLFLIAAIPIAVYLASQQQSLRSQAFAVDSTPTFKITGPNVIDHRATKTEIELTMYYPQSVLQPDSFRVSNTLAGLESAGVQTFTPPTQTIPWQLDTSLTTPTVYLQFRINNQWQTPLFASITYLPNH